MEELKASTWWWQCRFWHWRAQLQRDEGMSSHLEGGKHHLVHISSMKSKKGHARGQKFPFYPRTVIRMKEMLENNFPLFGISMRHWVSLRKKRSIYLQITQSTRKRKMMNFRLVLALWIFPLSHPFISNSIRISFLIIKENSSMEMKI